MKRPRKRRSVGKRRKSARPRPRPSTFYELALFDRQKKNRVTCEVAAEARERDRSLACDLARSFLLLAHERGDSAAVMMGLEIAVAQMIVAAAGVRPGAAAQRFRASADRLLAYLELYAEEGQPLTAPAVRVSVVEGGRVLFTTPPSHGQTKDGRSRARSFRRLALHQADIPRAQRSSCRVVPSVPSVANSESSGEPALSAISAVDKRSTQRRRARKDENRRTRRTDYESVRF
jgi:hypothetical protein